MRDRSVQTTLSARFGDGDDYGGDDDDESRRPSPWMPNTPTLLFPRAPSPLRPRRRSLDDKSSSSASSSRNRAAAESGETSDSFIAVTHDTTVAPRWRIRARTRSASRDIFEPTRAASRESEKTRGGGDDDTSRREFRPIAAEDEFEDGELISDSETRAIAAAASAAAAAATAAADGADVERRNARQRRSSPTTRVNVRKLQARKRAGKKTSCAAAH